MLFSRYSGRTQLLGRCREPPCFTVSYTQTVCHVPQVCSVSRVFLRCSFPSVLIEPDGLGEVAHVCSSNIVDVQGCSSPDLDRVSPPGPLPIFRGYPRLLCEGRPCLQFVYMSSEIRLTEADHWPLRQLVSPPSLHHYHVFFFISLLSRIFCV